MIVFNRLFDFFEDRVEPFPPETDSYPPSSFWPFLWYFAKPMWPWLLTMAALTGVIAILEISLFAFLGSLVDWLGDRSPESFIRDEKIKLIGMSLLVMVLLPLIFTRVSLRYKSYPAPQLALGVLLSLLGLL